MFDTDQCRMVVKEILSGNAFPAAPKPCCHGGQGDLVSVRAARSAFAALGLDRIDLLKLAITENTRVSNLMPTVGRIRYSKAMSIGSVKAVPAASVLMS